MKARPAAKADPAIFGVMYGALSVAVQALYASHPRPAVLREKFEKMKKDYLDDLLQQKVEDATIVHAETLLKAFGSALPKTRA